VRLFPGGGVILLRIKPYRDPRGFGKHKDLVAIFIPVVVDSRMASGRHGTSRAHMHRVVVLGVTSNPSTWPYDNVLARIIRSSDTIWHIRWVLTCISL